MQLGASESGTQIGATFPNCETMVVGGVWGLGYVGSATMIAGADVAVAPSCTGLLLLLIPTFGGRVVVVTPATENIND
jgi:hypothetical protein